MNCTNCGSPIENGVAFCTNCGAKVPDGAANNAQGQQNASYNYQANAGYGNAPQGNNYGGYDPYMNQAPQQPQYTSPYYQNPADKVPTTGEYIKWMFLYPLFNLIPIAGFIIYIVMCFKNAFDTSYKARANYFKAMLILWAISIGISIVIGVIITILITTGVLAGMDFFSDFYYYM